MAGAQTAAQGLALYVHWPFCLKKCPYCDFNSHVRNAVDTDGWRDALLRDLRWMHAAADEAGPVTSVFFGGGTPSLMPPAITAAVLGEADRLYGLARDAEITLEANPSTVEAGRFRGFRAAGVNRLSIGVQSLDDGALSFLGRIHDAEEARRAIRAANRIFERTSLDLIYALPGQTEADWKAMLDEALDFAPGHLSLYQLTIEPGTGFAADVAHGRFKMPGEDQAADLYALTQDIMDGAGLPAYEISNHARAGAGARHNTAVWQGAPYLGIGPGAHGRIRRHGAWHATAQVKKPERWLAGVRDRPAAGRGPALDGFEALSPAERASEILLTGLRMTQGIDLSRIEALTGMAGANLIDPRALASLCEDGWVERSAGVLRLPARGRLLLDSIAGQLIADDYCSKVSAAGSMT